MDFSAVIDHLKSELGGIRTGRAHPSLVENMSVEVYGSPTPLKGVASISAQDSKTLLIQPWDKGAVKAVEKAIQTSDLGINPQVDGGSIRLTMPALTEERRKEYVKLAHTAGEQAKISVRNMRKDELNRLKSDDSVSEDAQKRAESNLQEDVNATNKEIDALVKRKEEELLKV
jgi:ribosome recycling factor